MQIEIRPTLIFENRGERPPPIDLVWVCHVLKDIGRGSSLVSASKKSGASYRRSVWGKMNDVEAALGAPLITRTKGHGSKLTEFGEFLIQFVDEMQSAFTKYGDSYQEVLSKEIKKIQKSESVKWKFASCI
ncbi:hypothetical protein [Polynucleobacter necessarius]|uniref:hypothetical protein n=1 Tax=Polynucleobacter necessarius TaxID=576610 RepID=UPI0018D5507B|nr:hypothetical protein [Polynucleobacter necessarius]